jgi:hypothetical protein
MTPTPSEKKAAQKTAERLYTELALAEAKADYWNSRVNELDEDLTEAKEALRRMGLV